MTGSRLRRQALAVSIGPRRLTTHVWLLLRPIDGWISRVFSSWARTLRVSKQSTEIEISTSIAIITAIEAHRDAEFIVETWLFKFRNVERIVWTIEKSSCHGGARAWNIGLHWMTARFWCIIGWNPLGDGQKPSERVAMNASRIGDPGVCLWPDTKDSRRRGTQNDEMGLKWLLKRHAYPFFRGVAAMRSFPC